MADTGRGQMQLVTGAGAVALFVSLFLPWFEFPRDSVNGWQQATTDVFLLVVAASAIVSAVAPRGARLLTGTTVSGATALLGAIATVVVLWLLAFDFPEAFGDRGLGIYVALVASAVIAASAYAIAGVRAPGGGREDHPIRLSSGRLIAGAGGAFLFISLFLPWIGGLFDDEGSNGTLDGWSALLTLDVYFAITVAIGAGCALGVSSAVRIPGITISGASTVLGAVAVLLLGWFLLFDFPDVGSGEIGLSREIGPYLALLSAAVIAGGGLLATRAAGTPA